MGRGIELVEVVSAKADNGNQAGSKKAPHTSIQCFGDEYNNINSPHATSFAHANPDLECCHQEKPGLEVGWKPGVPECLFMTCICILVAMDAFNAVVVISLVPELASDLGQPLENVLWINTSYFLANAASQTISSMLADVFGHGPILLSAVVLATIGTGVCGGAFNLAGLIAGRSLQGTGGGGILAASFLIITNMIPKYHQLQFSNYVFRAQVTGSIIGAILGGIIGDYATTIWLFYSSFVFCALGMLVVPFAVDLRGCGQGKTGYICKLRRTDWLGSLLILLGVGCLLIGISWGGTRFAWDTAATLAPICVGASLLLVLVAYERFWTVHPFFSSAMFKSLSTTMIHISGFIHGLIISAHLHFLPLYLIFVKYLPHALTGLGLVALVALALPFLILVQKLRLLSHQPNLNPWILRLGWALATISTGCLTILDFKTPTPAWVILFLICGLSHALLTPSFIRCMFTRPFDPDSDSESDSDTDPFPKGYSKRKIPPILLHSILRTWGMCIAIPISGTIMLNQLFWDVERRFPFPGEVSFMVEFGALMPGGERDDYVDGFRVLWPVCTGVAALGAVLGGVWGRVR